MVASAQIILATGVGLFLLLVAVPNVVWSFRCDRQSAQYKLPGLLILGPFVAGVIYLAKYFS